MGKEEIKCKTFAKRPSFATLLDVCHRQLEKGHMHKLINRRHRCDGGSSLIE